MFDLAVPANLRGNGRPGLSRLKSKKPAPAGPACGLSTTRRIAFDHISLDVCAISHSPAEMRDEQQFMLEKYAIAATLPMNFPIVKLISGRNDDHHPLLFLGMRDGDLYDLAGRDRVCRR